MSKWMRKVCDLMAAICLVFDVNWDEDFGDDEYVKEVRG